MIRRLLCGLFGHDWRLAGARDLLRGRAGDLCADCGFVRWGQHRASSTVPVMKTSVAIPMSRELAAEITSRVCEQCGTLLAPPEKPGRPRHFCSGKCRQAHFREEHRPL